MIFTSLCNKVNQGSVCVYSLDFEPIEDQKAADASRDFSTMNYVHRSQDPSTASRKCSGVVGCPWKSCHSLHFLSFIPQMYSHHSFSCTRLHAATLLGPGLGLVTLVTSPVWWEHNKKLCQSFTFLNSWVHLTCLLVLFVFAVFVKTWNIAFRYTENSTSRRESFFFLSFPY